MNLPRILLLALLLQSTVTMASAQGVTLLTPTNTTWRYFTNGTDPGTEWALPGFDDSSWPQGVGLFGNDGNVYAPLGFNTPVPGPLFGSGITTYYRTHFNWVGSPWGVVLRGTNHVDDGCVVYLNGVEITRFNMPAGPPAFDTLAPAANPGGYPNLSAAEPVRVLMQISLDSLTNGNANPLANGDNVLAVEVHQNAATSSDVVFGMALFASGCSPPCTEGIQPTNRIVLEGRSTMFVVGSSNCAFPIPAYQWYRNIGNGEELILGATASSYTLTNAQLFDAGNYYCRLTTICGSVDSRQATLIVQHVGGPPAFLSASVAGSSLNKFRLTTDRELCQNTLTCGTDFTFQFNWQILESDNPFVDLGVSAVAMINSTNYEFTTSTSRNPAKQYQITVTPIFGEVGDLFGNLVRPGTFAETYPVSIFVQGLTGYTGTQDAEIHSNASADIPLGGSLSMKCDLDDNGVAQGLLRFANLFGSGLNQIPPGSRIRSATLTLNQIDPGSAVNLHRMLVDWDQSTITWNNLVGGITANGLEAATFIDATIPEVQPNGPVEIDVTASLQTWANGELNYGWALLPTGNDSWLINTSESGFSNAPLLTVAYERTTNCATTAFVTQPPSGISVREGQSLLISAIVFDTLNTTFQWVKNGTDIPGATEPSYTILAANIFDSGFYRLRVRCALNPAGFTISDECAVSVFQDITRPGLTWAIPEADGVTVKLRFSKPLTEASAWDAANYVFTPALAVSNAVLLNETSFATVTLTTAPREIGSNYTLRIANLRDTRSAGNSIFPNPTTVALTTARAIMPWDADGWYYNTNNLDTAPDWKNSDFLPGADWGFGSGLFGEETSPSILAAAPAPIATPLTANAFAPGDQLTTTYFRKTIDLPLLPSGARYVICHYTDDGFIAYLDGAEIHRFAMPVSAVTFTTRSIGIPTGEATYRSFELNASPGPHLLAVELHQASTTSADVLFGMEVRVMDAASPALSIARTANGGVTLNWSADNNWRLRRAADLSGPYLDVAIPAGTRFGTFTPPAASISSGSSFFRLDYTGRP